MVCLGGATADLDEYTDLVRALPVDLGAALVVVNHLRAVSAELFLALAHCTKIPVEVITDRLLVQPNRIFVLQEGWDLHVADGEFRLKPVSKPAGWTNVVSIVLSSLAKNWQGQLVAVILAGLDGDGAAALCEIKKARGITIAQKVESAGDPNMPSSAIASGYVDLILPIPDIAAELVRITRAKNAELVR